MKRVPCCRREFGRVDEHRVGRLHLETKRVSTCQSKWISIIRHMARRRITELVETTRRRDGDRAKERCGHVCASPRVSCHGEIMTVIDRRLCDGDAEDRTARHAKP